MVLVFLPLFMGVGYADSQGITEKQAELLLENFDKSDDELDLAM
jgi:hypothetical protein